MASFASIMANDSEEKFHKRRVQGSYLSVILSVSLVLFTLGLQIFAVMNAEKIIREFKENLGFTVYLKDEVSNEDMMRLQKVIASEPYTRLAKAISKEQAAESLKTELGEDFMQFLDYNPLPSSIEVKVKANYANTDSLALIQSHLMKSNKVKEVSFKKNLIENVQRKLRIVSIISLGFVALLFIVAVALINSSIRLSIYSKRFLIKSMMLVGATHAFVRSPFVRTGVLHGIYSAIIAIIMISVVMYYADRVYPTLLQRSDLESIVSLFGIVVFLGVAISWVSTSLAVRKFIRLRSNKLY